MGDRSGIEVLVVEVKGLSCSFRPPLDHNYQRTLPFPPPTTILGLAGAALGLSEAELWDPKGFLRGLRVSVLTKSEPGWAKDTWTLMKIAGRKIKIERSPYLRELLFFPTYTLVFGSDPELLRDLREALLDPCYALSLGREDELIVVTATELVEVHPGEPFFSGTVLPLDIAKTEARVRGLPAGRTKPPLTARLPLAFTVKGGIRHPTRTKEFTFIPHSFPPLEVPELAPMALALRGRNFVWLNQD